MKLSITAKGMLLRASLNKPFYTVTTSNMRVAFGLVDKGLLKHSGPDQRPDSAVFVLTDAGRAAISDGVEGQKR